MERSKTHRACEECVTTWRDLVREELWRYAERTGERIVERQDLLDQSLDVFQEEYPDAETPEQTMSRVLQELRDRGEIEFVDRGTYRILLVGQDEIDTLEEELERPEAKPGTWSVTTREVKQRAFQDRFRSRVIPNFGHRCGICGLGPEWFLDAAHLRPATEYEELAGDPSAGVALCKNHHEALDRGVIIIQPDGSLTVDRLDAPESNPEFDRVVLQYQDATIREPKRFELNSDALPSRGSRQN